MPISDAMRDALVAMALHTMLPALVTAAIVMAGVMLLAGTRQGAAGAALGLITGAIVGLWLRDALPLYLNKTWEVALATLPHALNLSSGESSWNRLPWAVLGALCVGRVAYQSDVHSGDGWVLRGGAAIAMAWWVLPEDSRQETVWLAPAFAAFVWAEWVLLDYLAAEPGSSSVAFCLVLSLLVAACVLIHAGMTGLMEANVVLACALTGVWVVAYVGGVQIGGAIPAVVVVLSTTLLMGHLQRDDASKIHSGAFVLPAGAPLVLAILLPFGQWPRVILHLMRLLLILIPLAIAIYLLRDAGPLDFGFGIPDK